MIRFILKSLENLEETTMTGTEPSPKAAPFPEVWVPLSSKLQGGNNSFTFVFSSLHPEPGCSKADENDHSSTRSS